MFQRTGSGPLARGRGYSIVLLLASTILVAALPTAVLHAQGNSEEVSPAKPFSIPAESLSDALIAFGRQAGVQVTVDSNIAKGIRTNAVSGKMTWPQAIQKMLGGTGLSYRLNGRMIVVGNEGASPIMLGPVRVGGTALPTTAMIGNLTPVLSGGEVADGGQLGILGNRSIMDTPFNQTSYTAEFIQNRQVRTIRDALKDTPSVRGTWGTGSPGQEKIQIRGFDVGGFDMSFGGLYGIVPASAALTEFAERVEILEGPGALLNGMSPGGGVGGTVNIVPKRAHDTPITFIEADYNSNLQFGGHGDIGRRFGKNKEFGLRLNGMIRSGPTAISGNGMKTALVGIGGDVRLKHVRLSADFGYQYRRIDGILPYLSLDSGVPVPDAAQVKRNLGQSWTYSEDQDIFGVFKGEVDIFRNVTAHGSVGVHDTNGTSLYYSGIAVSDQQGNGHTWWPFSDALRGRTIVADIGIRAQEKTGPITHDIAFSANRYWTESGWVAGYPDDWPDYSVNIYQGLKVPRPTVSVAHHIPIGSLSTLSSLGFADTVSALDKRIQITAGLRVQRVQSQNIDDGEVTSRYDKTALSPAVTAVFKPFKHMSFYGNWIQGLQQGTIVDSSYANRGQIFSPYKTTQYELGIKGDIGRFIATFDVFQVDVPSTVHDLNKNTLTIDGDERHRGLELNISGKLIHELSVTGGIMLIDPVLRHTDGGQYDGERASDISPVNFNMGFNYNFPFVKGLSFTADVIYTSSQYIERPVPRRSIPGWTRLDLGTRYVMRNPVAKNGKITFFLNVDNANNAHYWNSGGGNSSAGSMTMAAPRTFRFAVAADF